MSDRATMPPRCLVEGSGPLKTVVVMIYCHFSVALLCLNVMFDLLVLGVPVFILNEIGLLPTKIYLKITTAIINWTTPIVFFMPMVVSKTRIYCNDIDLMVECKSTDSLLLANHGSRIDWMVGMFVGFSTRVANRACDRIRVGFVCEALIQFMPLVGWYRKVVAKDIFVWRSFKQDAQTITKNIQDFHNADERRMLFLSPEGKVVDFGLNDIEYVSACRKFCVDQGYKPFDYVLTPRYKGSMCLLQQVQKSPGSIISICTAYVRDGKLLNCSLLSPDRVVPDIYTLNQGVGGSPVSIYIHLSRLRIAPDTRDPKAFMMDNYKEKNDLMMEWDRQTSGGTTADDAWMSKYSVLDRNYHECLLCQIGHAALMTITAVSFHRISTLLHIFGLLFFLVAGCHTVGWALNSTSMESVPFETGIKAIAIFLQERKKGPNTKMV